MTQNDKLLIIAAHLVPLVMLVAAVGPWPYGYYQLLRVVVFITAGLLALIEYGSIERRWAVALALLALIFNPLLPIHLPREVWAVFNIAGAGLLAAHLWVTFRKMRRA